MPKFEDLKDDEPLEIFDFLIALDDFDLRDKVGLVEAEEQVEEEREAFIGEPNLTENFRVSLH